MRWLIRKTESLSANQGELQDSIVETDKLRVGADGKADLVLLGAGMEAEHLVLTKGAKGSFSVKTNSPKAQIQNQDNKSVKKLNLSEGEYFKVGSYIFTYVKAPTGIDYALSITQVKELGAKATSLFPLVAMTLNETGFNMRRWSWYWMVFALLVGLVFPLLWMYGPQDTLKSIPVLSTADQIWSPGPLAKAHHIQGIADNCQVCHSELFSPVKDTDCENCHQVDPHLSVAELTAGNKLHTDVEAVLVEGSFVEGRCASCHIEHKDPSIVIREDEPMCTNCHSGIVPESKKAQEKGELDVSEGGITSFEQHPQFKLSMVEENQSQDQGQHWLTQRYDFDTEGLKEDSNLEFSHRLHLNPKGIDGPDGRTELSCANCHEPEQDGLLVKPILMEQHCSSCHSLTFEPTDLTRQVPHANLLIVKQSLEEYYSRLYALQNGPVRSKVNLDRPAKRPGKPKPDFYSAMKEWADDKAQDALEELVNNKACSTCHEIDKSKPKMQVKPVKIAHSWYPKSRFDHSSHEVFECESCHKASDSDNSADILIPDIKNCRSCHAGASDTHALLTQEIKTVSSCMSCHQYHLTQMDVSHE